MTFWNICLTPDADEMYRIMQWIDGEWEYARKKFGTTAAKRWDDHPEDLFLEEWIRQVTQYYGRAQAMGLDSEMGRQAVAKAAVTALAFGAAVIRKYGELPPPGTPSGMKAGDT